MINRRAVLVVRLLCAAVLSIQAPIAGATETVAFASGALTLHGLLYKPAGSGPFPAVLYNHGSAPGMLNNAAFDTIGPRFTAHGWVFFAPYRRGQGLSEDAGAYLGKEIEDARSHGGTSLAAETMVRLLRTDHLQDQLAAFEWLRKQTYVTSNRIATVGNSFGGIESLLGANKVHYCAAVDASGGAESWDDAPGLRELMLTAARSSLTPTFFFQAENDYTTAPSRTLYAAMQATHRQAVMRIYPRYGESPQQGHSFAWRGADVLVGGRFPVLGSTL